MAQNFLWRTFGLFSGPEVGAELRANPCLQVRVGDYLVRARVAAPLRFEVKVSKSRRVLSFEARNIMGRHFQEHTTRSFDCGFAPDAVSPEQELDQLPKSLVAKRTRAG